MNELATIIRDLAPTVQYGWPGRLYVFVLLVGIPFLAVLQPDDRDLILPSRRALYASAVIGVWILALLTVLVLWVEELPLSRVGLHLSGPTALAGWTVAATIGTLAGNFVVSRGAAKLGLRESRLTYHLMPRDAGERWAFFGVSASAGFCEELTYHGFLLAGLSSWLNNGWLAAVIANMAFGVLHGYQGPAGVVRAFLMGYVLCLPVIVGAGLWPAIAAHALVNIVLGFGLWRWMIPAEHHSDAEV